MLARARDERLALARLVLVARVGCVARVGAGVVAGLADFAAGLRAVRARDGGVFALARPMTQFATLVGAALELLTAGHAAGGRVEPAGLVLEKFLAANAGLLDEEGALGAGNVVGVALVGDDRVAARTGSGAIEAALGWPCSAGLGWLKDRSAAGTADFVEDSFQARRTLTAVA